MKRTTLADPRVRKLLGEKFVAIDLDIEKQPESGAWFATAGIPDC